MDPPFTSIRLGVATGRSIRLGAEDLATCLFGAASAV
jgi:hypothetical protein